MHHSYSLFTTRWNYPEVAENWLKVNNNSSSLPKFEPPASQSAQKNGTINALERLTMKHNSYKKIKLETKPVNSEHLF